MKDCSLHSLKYWYQVSDSMNSLQDPEIWAPIIVTRPRGWWSDQDTSAYKWPKYDSRKWVKLCLKYTVESTMSVVQAQCWTQAPQNWLQPSLYFTLSHQFSASLARGIPSKDAFGWKGIPSPAEATHGYAVLSSEQVLKKSVQMLNESRQ